MTHIHVHVSDETNAIARELATLFAPYSLFLVGGSVRDALLGRENDDLDFCTNAFPHVSEKILRQWGEQFWDPGASYGTVCASKGDVRVEVTTFRKDTYDPDSRKPEVEFGNNIWDDLRRRDFKVNAMAIEIQPNAFVMHALPGALEDLEHGLLHTPDNPLKSFADDPLRIIRAARFASQLGFYLEVEEFNAMAVVAPELDKVATERIVAEFDKTLLGKHAFLGVSLLFYTDVLERILPGVEPFKWLDDLPHDLETRWAGLLSAQGPQKAHDLLVGLKHNSKLFKNVPRIIALVNQFLARGGEWDEAQVRKFVWDAGEFFAHVIVIVAALKGTAYHDLFANIYYDLQDTGDLENLKQPLTGNDVIDWLAIEPGKEIGQALDYLQNLRLLNGPMTVGEARHQLSRWAESRGLWHAGEYQ